MEQRCAVLLHLIENIHVPLDRSYNLAAISQAAQSLLGILQCHHNLRLTRIEIGRMAPTEQESVVTLAISAILAEGVDLSQRTHDYCLDRLCKELIDWY